MLTGNQNVGEFWRKIFEHLPILAGLKIFEIRRSLFPFAFKFYKISPFSNAKGGYAYLPLNDEKLKTTLNVRT